MELPPLAMVTPGPLLMVPGQSGGAFQGPGHRLRKSRVQLAPGRQLGPPGEHSVYANPVCRLTGFTSLPKWCRPKQERWTQSPRAPQPGGHVRRCVPRSLSYLPHALANRLDRKLHSRSASRLRR